MTDTAGTSTTQVFTGQTVSRNGSAAATTTRAVTITAAAGRPVVTATGANLTFTESDSAAALDSVRVTDSDSNITGATSRDQLRQRKDVLAFTNQLGITGSWSAGTGVLTLSGTTTPANYQTALRTITYVNTNDNPDTSNRNVNFVASDAVGASNTATGRSPSPRSTTRRSTPCPPPSPPP